MEEPHFTDDCLDYEEPELHEVQMTIIHNRQLQSGTATLNSSNRNSNQSSNHESNSYAEIESLKSQLEKRRIYRPVVFIIICLLALAAICYFVVWISEVTETSFDSEGVEVINSTICEKSTDECNNIGSQNSSIKITQAIEDVITSTISNIPTAKVCLNGGSTVERHNKCICKRHYFGDKCEMTGPEETYFFIIFPEQFSTFQLEPHVFVATNEAIAASILDLNSLQRQQIVVNKHGCTFKINQNIIMKDGFHIKGLKLTLDIPKPVFGFIHNDWDDVSEGYLALPIKYASTKYLIATYMPSRFRRNSFISKATIVISSIHPRTHFRIYLSMQSENIIFNGVAYTNNDILNVSLSAFQSFQLSHTSDLSGTIIIGTRPFLVVTGNVCNFIESKFGCNPFLEMNLPTIQLDDLYVIPIIETRSRSTLRVLALNQTSVRISNKDSLMTKTLYDREFFDIEHYTLSCVQASESVMVMVYPHEIRSNYGDAFMMTIHGVHQYLSEYSFVVPTGFTSYVSITILSDEVGGFVMDDLDIENLQIHYISCGSKIYTTFSIKIGSGFHRARHIHQMLFGVWVYGNADYNAYGYPGGIAFVTSQNDDS